LLWKQQGISPGVVGLLWAWGVVAEIVFLWFLEPWRRRLGPWGLLAAGGAGAAVRWTAFAFSPSLWLLWPLQLLHGLSFAASYMGGLRLVERLSPPDSVSAAQTLSSALSAGVLIGLATIFSGALYDRYGALGYLAMSAMAVLGLIGAWRLRAGLAARG
jgi:PPP family 3-phenylpropionic acid transporter